MIAFILPKGGMYRYYHFNAIYNNCSPQDVPELWPVSVTDLSFPKAEKKALRVSSCMECQCQNVGSLSSHL